MCLAHAGTDNNGEIRSWRFSPGLPTPHPTGSTSLWHILLVRPPARFLLSTIMSEERLLIAPQTVKSSRSCSPHRSFGRHFNLKPEAYNLIIFALTFVTISKVDDVNGAAKGH